MQILKYGMGVLLATGMIFGQDSVALAGHTRDVNVVACSADGKTIASGGEDEKTFLWDAASHQEIASVGGGGAVMSVSISPDGKRIAAGERYHKVNLLDPAGKVVKVLEGHEAAVIATGFTADSKTLMTFSLDGGMRLWDAATGAAARRHQDSARQLFGRGVLRRWPLVRRWDLGREPVPV
jgi:WD40 repeat protein